MDQVVQSLRKAESKLQIADHMLSETYPLVKDPKLLVVVMENIFLACSNGIAAALNFEIFSKRLLSYGETFDSKFSEFKERCSLSYDVSHNLLNTILSVKDIVLAHKRSPVEFSRKGSFVICEEDYTMKTISPEQIRDYINSIRTFLNKVTTTICEDGRITI